MFVYARDLVAVLCLLQLDKAANGSALKKSAFHSIYNDYADIDQSAFGWGTNRERWEEQLQIKVLKRFCQSNCSVGSDPTFSTQEVKWVKWLSCHGNETHDHHQTWKGLQATKHLGEVSFCSFHARLQLVHLVHKDGSFNYLKKKIKFYQMSHPHPAHICKCCQQ